MSFETYSILKVRQAFDNADKPDPDMHWSHGTLW